jgi:hypothetical protein
MPNTNAKTKTIVFSALLGDPGSVNRIKPGGVKDSTIWNGEAAGHSMLSEGQRHVHRYETGAR